MKRTSLIAAAALAFAPALLSAQSVLLRMDPDVGTTLQYQGSMETWMQGGPMGGGGDQPFMRGMFYSTQTVTAAEGEVRTYEIRTDSMSVETPGMPGMSQMMNQQDLTGTTQVMRIDTRGQLVDIPDADEETQQMMSQMQGLAGMGLQLPQGEISPGDSWQADNQIDLPMGPGASGTMTMDMTYTLDRVDGGIAYISVTGPMTMEVAQGMQGMDASGTITGSMSFDIDRGVMTANETSMEMDISVQGMTMQMTQKVAMTLR